MAAGIRGLQASFSFGFMILCWLLDMLASIMESRSSSPPRNWKKTSPLLPVCPRKYGTSRFPLALTRREAIYVYTFWGSLPFCLDWGAQGRLIPSATCYYRLEGILWGAPSAKNEPRGLCHKGPLCRVHWPKAARRPMLAPFFIPLRGSWLEFHQ